MANQFYVHPGMDLTQGLSGLAQTVQAYGQTKKTEDAAQAAAAKEEALKAEVARLYREGTSEDIRQFTAANPEWGQIVMEQSSLRDQENALALTNTFYAAKEDPTKIPQLLDSYEARLKLNGLTDQESQEVADAREKASADPEGFLKSMEISVAPLDFDRYDRWVASQAEPGVDLTTDIQNMNHYIELKQKDPESAKEFAVMTGIDPSSTIEELQAKMNLMILQQKVAAGEASVEEKRQAAEQEQQQQALKTEAITNLIGEMRTFAEEHDWATGARGLLAKLIPGEMMPADRLEGMKGTLESTMALDQLSKVSLGAISESELAMVKRAIADLNLDQGKEYLNDQLDIIEYHYSNLMNTLTPEQRAEVDGGGVSPGVTEQISDEELLSGLGL